MWIGAIRDDYVGLVLTGISTNESTMPAVVGTDMPTPIRLLLVDDRVDELRLLIGLLRQHGYHISVAFDGAQGYHRAQALQPDLILMDVSMPVLSGFDACRLLKSEPATSHIPIIFLSSANELKDRLEGLCTGGVDYVVKPYEPAEVLARIRIHLNRTGGVEPEGRRVLPLDTALPPSKDRTLVNAACIYLTSRLSRTPSMLQLARVLHTNEKRVSRAFRNELGMTVFEFLRQERMRRATRLLLETSLTITQIAQELGYSSSANFATSFRAHTGQTPSEFRSPQQVG